MKAEQISAAFLSRNGSGDTQLIYGLDKDQWLKAITAGQILKGRVLRVYSENKYGVDFGGQERIVDSAMPLTKGSNLTGRVVSLNEHTVSMKIVHTLEEDNLKNTKLNISKSAQNKSPIDIEAKEFKVSLTMAQEAAIIKASNRSENAAVAIRVGMYLVKLGLPITAELVRVVTNRVLDAKASSFIESSKRVPELASYKVIDESLQSDFLQTVFNLKDFFLKDLNASNDGLEGDNSFEFPTPSPLVSDDRLNQNGLNGSHKDSSNGKLFNQFFSTVFNVNNGSHVQHRFQTLPIIIDGKLIEFDVAFFDHSERDSENLVLSSKRIKFALKTEFGFVNLEARTINNRLNISVSSKSDFFISQMLEYDHELSLNLANAGWSVENIKYNKADEEEIATYAIIKHVLQQDSLDIVV